jgi:hypothetical protein
MVESKEDGNSGQVTGTEDYKGSGKKFQELTAQVDPAILQAWTEE